MARKELYAGIDLGGTQIKFGLCTADGEIVFSDSVHSHVDRGPEKLLQRLEKCGQSLISEARKRGGTVRYIGIGTPGTVDPAEGRVIGISPNIRGWEGTRIRHTLEDRLGVRVRVDNDVNAMAVAEHRFGSARGCDSALTVTIGTGIGGGIIIGGELYRGSIGSAGEIGHITVVRDGRECNCGRRGCLEQYASAGSFLRYAEEIGSEASAESPLKEITRSGKKITLRDLFAAFSEGDPVAEEAVGIATGYLANGLASACVLLNPAVVVIGGGVVDGGGEKLIGAIREKLVAELFTPLDSRTEVVAARLGNKAGIVGAAFLGE